MAIKLINLFEYFAEFKLRYVRVFDECQTSLQNSRKIFRVFQIMDVESNNRNCDSKDPSFNASSVANDTFIRLLKKHDFDAIVEMMTLDGEKSDNRSDTMKKESYRSKSKDSTNTNREVLRADAGENLKECSVKHNISELSDHSVLNSDVNAEKYCSDISKSTVQPKFSFSSYKTHHYDRSLAYSNTNNEINLISIVKKI